jgi:predicted nucleotide-binding protein
VNVNEVIAALEQYRTDFQGMLSRFYMTYHGPHMLREDNPVYRQKVFEVCDLLNDALGGRNSYSLEIGEYYQEGIANLTGSPSYKSVEDIIGVLGGALTRLKRNPDLVWQSQACLHSPINKNVFVIHGRDEAKWRELKDILRDRFGLNLIILREQPESGCPTLIEKFEFYAKNCSYAIAIFTPDDEVKNSDDQTCLQARPNVIYELGWFCGRLGRERVMLLLKEGTTLFSDFGGIIQKRFRADVAEKIEEIRRDLKASGIIAEPY